MDTSNNDETMAQMNIKLPATMKQSIKVSASMAGVPLKEIAQDALKLYLDSADETLLERRVLVVNAFKEITKRREIPANGSSPLGSTQPRYLCW